MMMMMMTETVILSGGRRLFPNKERGNYRALLLDEGRRSFRSQKTKTGHASERPRIKGEGDLGESTKTTND